MITPRRTRLVRVGDLHAFREAIAGSIGTADSSSLIVVPTAAAAVQLQRLPGEAPRSIATRDGLYDRLHERLSEPPRRLSPYEREAIARAAARDAHAGLAAAREVGDLDGAPGTGVDATSANRPGLIAAMLGFYDQLRRLGQRVDRFEELLVETLERDAEFDRGARVMLRQTRFLAAMFRSYEERVESSGSYDEHVLRRRLIAEPSALPVRAIVVTVADWIAEPGGLFPADFDLLTRLPGLESLDVIATNTILESGFHERIHQWLPGVEEVEFRASSRGRPRVVVPGGIADDLWFTVRDREEELIEIVRRSGVDGLERAAVVYKRPLPYLYLAGEVFGGAGVRYRTSDTVPLAVEPSAAALDLVLEAVSSSFTRDALIALLRSPHFRWHDGSIPRDSVSALDRWLSEERYLGDVDRLAQLAGDGESISCRAAALPALRAAMLIGSELAPLTNPAPASEQIDRLLRFLTAHQSSADDATDRERRARAAIEHTLEGLAAASRAHDDSQTDVESLARLIRRWIEEQTFVIHEGMEHEDTKTDEDTKDEGAKTGALWFVDERAARYGEFDAMTIVGLVEGEWPDPPQRNIFYAPSLLNALGWPSEKDWRRAAEARFLDLLASPAEHVTLSTITLDNEALVERSSVLDDVPRAGLSTMALDRRSTARLFLDELLSIEPPLTATLDNGVRVAAEARLSRSPAGHPEFHGEAGSVSRAWSVSAIETYLDCPFKFFARHLLKLQEEPEDEEVMDPRRQGELVHQVFETFFKRWQTGGHRAITAANIENARVLFVEVVDECLAPLPDTEAALERTRLLGSPAAAGLGEAVFRMEAERSIGVAERLLEERLDGRFTFETANGTREIELRGKTDRVDLLDDGTFRLIDYKLGWPPNRARALQLPVYSLCAEQKLDGRNGRRWRLGEAAYIAFKGPRRVVPLFSTGDRDRILREAQQRLADAVDAIERGEFPPRPFDVYRCDTCEYSAVCRKDYVGDV